VRRADVPIHDWTRSDEAAFHDFELGWGCKLSARLNQDVLPPTFFAMTETIDLRPPADLCRLEEPDEVTSHRNREDGLIDAEECPPPGTRKVCDQRRQYATRIVSVRDDLRQPTAAILFVTGQDKDTPYRLDALEQFAVGAVTRGIHLLVVDLFPPSKRDPQGVHKLIWDRIRDEPFELPPDKQLTLAAYSAGSTITGYVEPIGVGDTLPDMPIFLTAERYVPCPLEATYQASWDAFPKALRGPLLEPPA
jgi:hypothetical protein